MRKDLGVLAVPSVVYTANFSFLSKNLLLPVGGRFSAFTVGLVIFNVYCLGMAQVSKLKGRDPLKYLWIFSGYTTLPLLLALMKFYGRSPLISFFLAYVISEVLEFWIFKDVFLSLSLVRLALLTLLTWGYATWLVI